VKPSLEPSSTTDYQFGEFRLDAAKRQLWRNDLAVPLTPRVFETLLYLVEHPNVVLDKERIMEAVWPDSIVEENNLTQNISGLRRVFGEKPDTHRYIVTVPGRGYRFVAEVKKRRADSVDDNIPANAATVPPPEPAAATGSEMKVEPETGGGVNPGWLAFAVALVILALIVWWNRTPNVAKQPQILATVPVALSEKSIAVLPFTNLSSEQENAFFAEGVQDDILTALAKLADLKVISRTSVAGYAAGPVRDLREIARELGVANILEGSVRRAGSKVRVTAQLIETRTNTHLWAETYDRDLTDVFAIQSEIARNIATALKAKLAPEEKARLDVRPTANPEAYVLYLTARGMQNATEAEKVLTQAIALDPGFALAYARASILNSSVIEDKLMRRAKARAQADEAVRLAPQLGEAHAALGLCLYWGDKKYDEALKEFEIAAATSPNNADVHGYIAGIYRRQGRWRESIASFERAQSLDPRNRAVAFLSGNNRLFMRDWAGAAAGYNRALEITPDAAFPKVGLAYLELFRNQNPAAGRKLLHSVVATDDDSRRTLIGADWDLAMVERDFAAAEKILAGSEWESLTKILDAPLEYYRGRVALARGDTESAQRDFAAARPIMEKQASDDPTAAEHHRQLGLLFSYMQMKEDAIREGRRAVEMEPENRNAFHGANQASNLALIYALVGEPDEAMTIIERLITVPGPVQWVDFPSNITLADLRLRWEWDGLRSNPRFQKIVSGPEPKTIY
jgi:TolB-like protein/DNA-binding winged helix-turn-helix (wHTH) protein/Tfp pilus assembly protein PilF